MNGGTYIVQNMVWQLDACIPASLCKAGFTVFANSNIIVLQLGDILVKTFFFCPACFSFNLVFFEWYIALALFHNFVHLATLRLLYLELSSCNEMLIIMAVLNIEIIHLPGYPGLSSHTKFGRNRYAGLG